MKPSPMMDALKNRKMKALDITILIGTPEDAEGAPVNAAPGDMAADGDGDEKTEREALDLAPDATEVGRDLDEKDVAFGRAGHNANMMPGEEIINGPDPAEEASLIEEALKTANLGKNSIAARGMMKKASPKKV